MKKIFLLLAFFFTVLSSQELPIQWSGDFRVRSEADGRDFQTNTPLNIYTLMRARLAATVTPAQNYLFYIQLQDSRLFGEEKDALGKFNTVSNTKNLDLHQAYIRVDKFLVDEFSFKLGRFEIAYANERIFGALNWNNIARSFDGVLFRYALNNGFADAYVLNTGETNTQPSPVSAASVKYSQDKGQLVFGTYASQKISDELSTDAYFVHQIDANQTKKDTFDLQRTTLGTFGKIKSGSLFGDAEFSYQLGKKSGIDVSAYMIALMAGYETGIKEISTISVHLDMLSGRKNGDTKYKSYEPLYSTGHKFYGFMDFFTSFPTHTFDRGLINTYLRFTSKSLENLTLTATLHNFSLQNYITVTNPTTLKTHNTNALGNELDIVAQWKYSKNLLFECGVSGFLPSEIMRINYGGSDVGTWGYISTQFTF